jgi:predicted DNA-binding transcriptional regulator AlpA
MTGYLRLSQIVGNPKQGIPAIIPVSKSTWWAWVQAGRVEKPLKLGQRVSVWRVEYIRELIERLAA